jgi:hypothetical protein
MTQFEEKLTVLLEEGLRTLPNSAVVGAFIGAAIAATIKDGRKPRELFGVLEDSIQILESS